MSATIRWPDIPAHPCPFLAPHFCDHVLSVAPHEPQVIDTTLHYRLQRLLERLLNQYVATRRHQGIVNGALMLVDRRDMAVRALVGSADFFDARIPTARSMELWPIRSPGSTLKPFLYGLAIDQGLIHPHSILRDAPSAFGAYQPENFDGRYIGPVNAGEALIRSRNVPAIWLANQLANPTLHGFFCAMPASPACVPSSITDCPWSWEGGELSMEELVRLYGLLANKGKQRSLRFLRQVAVEDGRFLLSPQAAFMVLDMLAANPRPDGGGVQNGGQSHWPIAWKTGTSWGFHDAWTVGVVGDYVLAVWVGNFDGKANPAFIGLKAATPLFFPGSRRSGVEPT